MKPVEQVSEVKTSKLGAILLTLMVIFIFSISQTFLNDISYIIKKPLNPSVCVLQLATQSKEDLIEGPCQGIKGVRRYWESQKIVNTYKFNSTDIQYELDTKYKQTIADLDSLFVFNKDLKSQGQMLESQRVDLLDQDPELSPIQIKLTKQEIQDITQQRDSEYQKIEPKLNSLKQDYKEAYNKVNFYKFFYFLAELFLQLIFVLPIFVLGLKKYFQLKKSNSPYTVIATAVAVAASILLLQVVLGFLLDALPWNFLYRIWEWLENFQFLKYIFYYSVVIATIALFGGVVYYIQKTTYAPEKVAKRRVLKGLCPRCESRIRDSYNNCRGCGLVLKRKCPNCKQNSTQFFKFCSNCGHNLTKK